MQSLTDEGEARRKLPRLSGSPSSDRLRRPPSPKGEGSRLTPLRLSPERVHLGEVAVRRRLAARLKHRFHRLESLLELGVGRAQDLIRIEPLPARHVGEHEQEIAQFLGDMRVVAEATASFSSAISSSAFSSTAPISGQSKPTFAALSCSLTARCAAGRAADTPSRTLCGLASSPLRSARSAFSSALIRAQLALTSAGVQCAFRRRHGGVGGSSCASRPPRHRRNRTILPPRPCAHERRPAAANRPVPRADPRGLRSRWPPRPHAPPRPCRARSSRMSARYPRDSRSEDGAAPP